MNFAVIYYVLSIVLMLCKRADEANTYYCDTKLCRGLKHIGCENNGTFSEDCSKNAKIHRIPICLREAIVSKHNEFRNKVASGNFSIFKPAGHMCTMKWHIELAELAKLNVKRCIIKHDACHNTADFYFAGQNLALTIVNGTATVENIALLQIEEWFNEFRDTTMSDIESYYPKASAQIDSFSQLMQDKATHVGCAILRQTINDITVQNMACNYAFMNIRGRAVYTTRFKATSLCVTGVNRNFRNLCSPKEECYPNKL